MVSPVLWCALLCSFYSAAVAGGNEHNFVAVPASSFQPDTVCSTSTGTSKLPNGASVPLAHRHGPCAPSGASGKPSLAERLRRDRARADYIIGKASRRAKTLSEQGEPSVPTFLGDSVDSLEYVVTLGIGTPAVQQTVLIDTGSDLSWVQCQPCNSAQCYPQKDPLFDPSKSSTFAPISCNTDACKALSADGYDNGCPNSTGASLCGYAIKYGNRAVTTGVYSTETLTVLNTGVSVNNFSFGCGTNQHGPYDKFDGLLGLGGAPESLVSQTSSVYGGAFSYCLPPTSGSPGFLTLGAPRNNTADFLFTPMRHLAPELARFYVVTLTGISVAGKALDIPPAVFSKGMIIDSGTVITGLPKTAFAALRTALRSAMSQYPLLPPSDSALDTCYDFTGHSSIAVPKVALTFSGGTTVDLSVPSGILVEGCLAFAGESSDGSSGIIGNVNQRTFEMLYDSGRGNVGLRAGAC